jgi:chromosome partitioning protein
MLMIILIGSEKGGVGKSTLATNFAVLLASKGKDVVIVDTDRQSTSANWAQYREETEQPRIECIRQYGNLTKTLEALKSRYKIIIVDCQGSISKELQTGLLAADVVVMPFKPSQWDLDTLPSMIETVETAKNFNSKLTACAVMSMCPTNARTNEQVDARAFFKEYPDVTLLTNAIYDRKTYRDAASSGLGVIELDNKKAIAEVHGVLTEVVALYQNRKSKEGDIHG